MCFLAFYAYLRVGEITVSDPKAAGNIIQFSHLAKAKHGNNESGYALTFYSYKHSFNQRPFTLTIQKSHNFCPVDYLRRYIAVRCNRPDSLFMVSHHTVTRTQFCTCLCDALRVSRLDAALRVRISIELCKNKDAYTKKHRC